LRVSIRKETVSKMEYVSDPQVGREGGEEVRDRVATKEEQLVPRLLLCLRDGIHYGYRLEERLGELGFEGPSPGGIYGMLWQMEQEGMVFCDREGGGFGVPQRWYELTEVGEAYLESYAGSLARYGDENGPFSRFQDERPGSPGRGRG
jgi:PadR family transcriptional regulator